MTGNWRDLDFEIKENETLIAKARGEIFTLRDRHVVDVFGTAADDELFIAICMTTLQINRARESQQHNHGNA